MQYCTRPGPLAPWSTTRCSGRWRRCRWPCSRTWARWWSHLQCLHYDVAPGLGHERPGHLGGAQVERKQEMRAFSTLVSQFKGISFYFSPYHSLTRLASFNWVWKGDRNERRAQLLWCKHKRRGQRREVQAEIELVPQGQDGTEDQQT